MRAPSGTVDVLRESVRSLSRGRDVSNPFSLRETPETYRVLDISLDKKSDDDSENSSQVEEDESLGDLCEVFRSH